MHRAASSTSTAAAVAAQRGVQPMETATGPAAAAAAAWYERASGSASSTSSLDGARAGWPPPAERLPAVVARLRERPAVTHPPVSGRSAAVLVGLFEDCQGVVRVLLTQRSSRLSSHRGEVCLPGGKRDEDDADDVATALREAQEELGLDPSRVTVLGTLPPVLSMHHLSVTPVLALVPPDLVPQPNPNEVAAAFTVPLAVFLGQVTDPRVSGDSAAGVALASDAAGIGRAAVGGEEGMVRRTRRRVQDAGADTARGVAVSEVRAMSWRAGDAREGRRHDAEVGICEDCAYERVAHSFRDINWGEHRYRIHSFQYGEFDVWGLTATICIAAAQVALGRAPSFQERCPGGQHYSAFYWDGTAVCARLEGDAAAVSADLIANLEEDAATTREAVAG